MIRIFAVEFQSTYLYKVRRGGIGSAYIRVRFQSTYLYKVRPIYRFTNDLFSPGFNPRTYIRYDRCCASCWLDYLCFNPRTYIRYDSLSPGMLIFAACFNPRTYIRYDFWVPVPVAHLFCFNPRTYIRYDFFNLFFSFR